MENERAPQPTPDEASIALAGALDARRQLADSLTLPPYFSSSIGAAIALQLATSAAGPVSQDAKGWLLLAGGWAVLVAVAGIQLARFRRLNGVWVGGLVSRVVLGTATAASVSYAVALAGAIWSAFAGQWWLMVCCSLAGGVGYAWSGQRWWRTYRKEPEVHGRGESAIYLALLVALALCGVVLLLIQS